MQRGKLARDIDAQPSNIRRIDAMKLPGVMELGQADESQSIVTDATGEKTISEAEQRCEKISPWPLAKVR